MSRLAVAALVLAVIPVCPPVNLAGVFTGLVAVRRIRAAPDRIGGRRVAWAAVLAGWLSSIAWSVALWWAGAAVQSQLQESMVAAIEATIIDGAARPESIRSMHWAAGSEPDAEQIVATATESAERYGRLERVSITSLASGGTMAQPTYTTALTLFFEGRDQRVGSAQFHTVPGTMRVRLARLTILDADAGNIVIGEPGP
ncbi:MAG: hypothetical protein ACYTJ0_11935 [Planctomycetota bacterium]